MLQFAAQQKYVCFSSCNLQEEINVKDSTPAICSLAKTAWNFVLQFAEREKSGWTTRCNLLEEKNPNRRLTAICRKRYKKKEEGECQIFKTKIR